MRQKKGLILAVIVYLSFISSRLLFSQEVQPQSETLWLWGEALSVDIQNKQLMVKYLDFETDLEKEMLISVDEKTTYENIKSIDEIKLQDSVSIDYTVSPDGKNIAKNIIVEKADETTDIPQEVSPEEKVESIPPLAQ